MFEGMKKAAISGVFGSPAAAIEFRDQSLKNGNSTIAVVKHGYVERYEDKGKLRKKTIWKVHTA